MSFLTDDEKDQLEITRMIFHVVGRELDGPVLLEEIAPPEHADFFVERVRSALKGNLFTFRDGSDTEAALRAISTDAATFTERTQALAKDFQKLHTGPTSQGVLFVFEIALGGPERIFAIVKYDNDDVVRYILRGGDRPQVPRLERFHESFVRKAEAMQKIALIRLQVDGGLIMVKDRSKPAHISDYFERFLGARRVNSPEDMSGKVVEAFKNAYKQHRDTLPEDIRRGGVNRLFDVFRQGGHRYDPDDCEALVTSVFGQVAAEAPLRRTLQRQLRLNGVADETFDIDPERVQKPRRRRMETVEGTDIYYDEGNAPRVTMREDGRTEILIVTTGLKSDDVDTAPRPRGR